jgi:hypothetical protein
MQKGQTDLARKPQIDHPNLKVGAKNWCSIFAAQQIDRSFHIKKGGNEHHFSLSPLG